MASVPDWREGPLVHPLEVVVVEVQHFDEVEGGEGGAADAAQPAVGLGVNSIALLKSQQTFQQSF